MLEAAGVPFAQIDTAIDEDALKAQLRRQGAGAADLAIALAEGKALSAGSAGLVIGSDQTLETDDGAMLDKPASPEDARSQLRRLAGRTHRLHSAAAVVEEGAVAWRACETVSLTMRPLSDAFVEAYVREEFERIRWSVGGYLIESRGVQLFERIEGSHFAILGLPLLPLLAYLRARKVLPS